MNRNKLELAVNEINDSYIEEAMTFKKASVMSLKKVAGIVAAAIAVIIIGTVGTIAVVHNRELKKVTVESNSISVGTKPLNWDEPRESTDEVIDPSNPDEIVMGDEDTGWVTKKVITRDYLNEEIFCYDDVSQALKDYKAPFYLDHIIGELVAAEITKEYDEEWRFISKSISIHFVYDDGDILIQDTITEQTYYGIDFKGEVQNAREYENANGLNITIVDYPGDNEMMSFVLISYDDHNGFIWFINMDDDHIHDVLDLISLN